MSNHLSLNELYDQFSQGLLEKKQFEGLLFEVVLEYLIRYNLYNWEKDDCIDFLSWLYPRLSRATYTYQHIGATFESYIYSMVRWSAREYRVRDTHHLATEQAVWSARIPEMYAHMVEPDYLENEKISELEPTLAKNPRQLLVLILKCYYCLSEDAIERLAPILGIETQKLKEMVEKLKGQRYQKDEEIRSLKERIHSQYYRCIVYEKRIKLIPEDSYLHQKVKTRLEKARYRLAALRKKLAAFRKEATNNQVAEIMGLSKGTVDASLYNVKRKYTSLLSAKEEEAKK